MKYYLDNIVRNVLVYLCVIIQVLDMNTRRIIKIRNTCVTKTIVHRKVYWATTNSNFEIKLPKHSNVSGEKSSSETYTQCIVLIDGSIKCFHQRTDCAKFCENQELDPKIATAIVIQ